MNFPPFISDSVIRLEIDFCESLLKGLEKKNKPVSALEASLIENAITSLKSILVYSDPKFKDRLDNCLKMLTAKLSSFEEIGSRSLLYEVGGTELHRVVKGFTHIYPTTNYGIMLRDRALMGEDGGIGSSASMVICDTDTFSDDAIAYVNHGTQGSNLLPQVYQQRPIFVEIIPKKNEYLRTNHGNFALMNDARTFKVSTDPMISDDIALENYGEGPVRIDIPKEDYIEIEYKLYKQWKKYIDHKINTKIIDYSTIAESTLAISAQAVGAILVNTLTNPSHASWIEYYVKGATGIGLVFTLASTGTRLRNNNVLSGIMIKFGATAVASAIILSLGLSLPPILAGIAGLVACLLLAIAAAMA